MEKSESGPPRFVSKGEDVNTESVNIFGGGKKPSIMSTENPVQSIFGRSSQVSSPSEQGALFNPEKTLPFSKSAGVFAGKLNPFANTTETVFKENKQSTVAISTFGALPTQPASTIFSASSKPKPSTVVSVFGNKAPETFGSSVRSFKSVSPSGFGSTGNITSNLAKSVQSSVFGGSKGTGFKFSSSSGPADFRSFVSPFDSDSNIKKEKVSKSKSSLGSSSKVFKETEGESEGFPYAKKFTQPLFQKAQKSKLIRESDTTKGPVSQPILETTMIIAVDIPLSVLDKSVLENHFNKFGLVKRVVLNRKTNQASIYFADHDSAVKAKAKGKKIHPMLPEIKLFFGAPTQKSESKDDSKPVPELKTRRPPTQLSSNVPPLKSSRMPPNKPQITKSFALKPPAESIPIKKSSFEKSSTNVSSPIPKVFGNTKQVSPEIKSDKSKSKVIVKKQETRSKAPSEHIASIKEPSRVVSCEAANNYDKYLILDARDKIMRSKLKKEVDVMKARYLLASCPDMCPEKERYSRDIQYDVSVFEMNNNEIDIKWFVKKFSRSSADKDEPLPHELRPGPVLRMTMDFLTCNIISKADNDRIQIDLWYNYLLNRTRAIRNDITQQHLQDSNAVYVLERCIRFHIHCSHELCEESADCFDPKINNEHLSKSFQSLKELYVDMSEKGIYFKTEAEFRSYELLLGANDGNIIFKYLKFRSAVRKSPYVQFAVKVLHSMHTNNYIKFFRLLKEASYLQACLMHKYFYNIRCKALNVIMKAYASQALPTDKMSQMLGFSSEGQMQNYISHFGIDVNEEAKAIISKTCFIPDPKEQVPTLKSDFIKKNSTLVNIIENGEAPENPLTYYEPHNSFDFMGYLKEDAVNAHDQSPSKVKNEDVFNYFESDNESIQSENLAQETDDIDYDKFDDISPDEDNLDYHNSNLEDNLVLKVESMANLNLLIRYFKKWKSYSDLRKQKRLLLVRGMFLNWKAKASSLSLLRKKNVFRLTAKYFNRWKIYVENSKWFKGVISKSESVLSTILAKKYFFKWRNFTLQIALERKIKLAKEYLLSRKYLNKWRTVTEHVLNEKKAKLFYETSRLKYFLTLWRDFCTLVKNKRTRLEFESFPAIGLHLSPDKLNTLLGWGYERDMSLNLSATQISDIDEDILAKCHKHRAIDQLSDHLSWTALPIVQRFKAITDSNKRDVFGTIGDSYFKILLLYEAEVENYMLKWLKRKFNINESTDCQNEFECRTGFDSHETKYSVFIKGKQFEPDCSFEGASLVVFAGNKNISNFDNIIDSMSIPYLLILWTDSNEKFSETKWELSKSSIDNPYTSEKLFEYICKAWQFRNSNHNLKTMNLVLFVEKVISKYTFSPINDEVQKRREYDNVQLVPADIVDLYNASLLHIIRNIEESVSIASNVLPPEWFSLSSNIDLDEINHTISGLAELQLPNFSLVPDSFCEEEFMNYISLVCDNNWGAGLETEIRRIISKTYDDCEYFDSKSFFVLPWVEILFCCMFFKLSLLPDINIIYSQLKMDAFDLENVWIKHLRASKLPTIDRTGVEYSSKRKNVKENMFAECEPKKIKITYSTLLQDLEQEKENFLSFEKSIESSLMTDEELDLLCQNHGLNMDSILKESQ